MKVVALICRILLGLMFVVFGANGIHHFFGPMPTFPPGSLVGDYFTAMAGSGWMKAISTFQLIGGLLVLFGGTLPLGLCILCPITVNILCFHIFLTGGGGIGMGLFVTALELILIYAYRDSFAGILSASQKPTV